MSDVAEWIGLVIWPVKIVPEMTYNVLSGTLRLYTTITTQVDHVWCSWMKNSVFISVHEHFD